MSPSAKAEQSVNPVLCLDLISLVGISKEAERCLNHNLPSSFQKGSPCHKQYDFGKVACTLWYGTTHCKVAGVEIAY